MKGARVPLTIDQHCLDELNFVYLTHLANDAHQQSHCLDLCQLGEIVYLLKCSPATILESLPLQSLVKRKFKRIEVLPRT